MSLNAMILLNVLLDVAVVSGLTAVLVRPFVLERREQRVRTGGAAAGASASRMTHSRSTGARSRFTGESQTDGST